MASQLLPEVSDPHPDLLGGNWVYRTIFLSDDDGGAPKDRRDVAVLVHESDLAKELAVSRTAALYLPGFLDTFFHTEQAAAWREHHIPLVGLEFRRSGRALRSYASRDDIRDLRVREEEIGIAIDFLRLQGAERIILIGHSTGGLQAVLWASGHPGTVDVVILNSPWFDHNGPELERGIVTKAVGAVSKALPRLSISKMTGLYAKTLHVSGGGEWDFNPKHKPITPMPVHAGFFAAVRKVQAELAKGLNIEVPMLVAHSDKSGSFKKPTPAELAATDVVLGVEDMKRIGPTLGSRVDLLEVPGGVHDLALSARPARDLYTRESIKWALDKLED